MATPDAVSLKESINTLLSEVTAAALLVAQRSAGAEFAEDIASETAFEVFQEFLTDRLLESLDVKNRGRIFAFVKTTARNKVLDSLKMRRRGAERDALHHAEIAASTSEWARPDAAYDARRVNESYDRAVSMLPKQCRRAYHLVHECGKSYNDAAAEMGVTKYAISKYLVTAMHHLRSALDPRAAESPRGGVKHSSLRLSREGAGND